MMTPHDEIEAAYGIRPGERCGACGVPVTAREITNGYAVLVNGQAYHDTCAPQDDHVPEDSAQIAVDHARRTEGW